MLRRIHEATVSASQIFALVASQAGHGQLHVRECQRIDSWDRAGVGPQPIVVLELVVAVAVCVEALEA